ncbi:hypothetical protein P8C59_006937 [Phyllachora maydis]|uniref:Uncharacterized protein n=1 Tax=Phyllachora maydis TaxID=1825666 RepID=A0AAD9I929_9PEZI|nr:hypothetical protein P8C59_006937 [Phyllachora maydis]
MRSQNAVPNFAQSKMVNGMFYNPVTYRWEGNDNVLSAFDMPTSSPSTASTPAFIAARDRDATTPRPALITPIGVTKGVQVVGGMVFDPQNMCWLKYAPQSAQAEEQVDPLDDFNGFEDEDDVFKDIPDLEERTADCTEPGQARVSDPKDDWLVGEEFDVGPEFVRRQREEEERWRKKCQSWSTDQSMRDDSWKWRIRDIVNPSLG